MLEFLSLIDTVFQIAVGKERPSFLDLAEIFVLMADLKAKNVG